jgi:hypothetical protein
MQIEYEPQFFRLVIERLMFFSSPKISPSLALFVSEAVGMAIVLLWR